MKNTLLLLLLILVVSSCKKPDDDSDDGNPTDPYALPWNTKYIHYENIKCGNHCEGYRLFYKDSILKEEFIDFDLINISKSMLVNDSIMHLYFVSTTGSYVLSTRNGGITWKQYDTGPPIFKKFHFVNIDLTYCVIEFSRFSYITGIGNSDLSAHKDSMMVGLNYLSDFGTDVVSVDSTIIEINDSISYVVRFN